MPAEPPHTRRHRGQHPQDARLFLEPRQRAAIRTASGELAWLLERGYTMDASLKLVGDRHGLRKRQRMALLRGVCAPGRAAARRARQVAPEAVRGRPVLVDGLNQLITVEVALSGGVLVRGTDGALRDLASVHGTYRLVSETPRAVEAIGAWLAAAGAGPVHVLLDRPVSNTGRMAAVLREIAAAHGWPWAVELRNDVDATLRRSEAVVASSDAGVLDAAGAWLDLAGAVVTAAAPAAVVLEMAPPAE